MTKFEIKEKKPFTPAATRITVKKVHQKSYCQYETGYFFSCLLDFACMRNDMSIIAYLKTKEKISKSSFLCYYNNSRLANYKKQGMFDSGVAKVMLTSYFEKNNQEHSNKDCTSHRQLSLSYIQWRALLGTLVYSLGCHGIWSHPGWSPQICWWAHQPGCWWASACSHLKACDRRCCFITRNW